MVLWVTAVFAILAIVISLLLPVRYTATVTLLPPQESSSMGAALTSQLGNLGGMARLAGGESWAQESERQVRRDAPEPHR